jgi:hypothetical protein
MNGIIRNRNYYMIMALTNDELFQMTEGKPFPIKGKFVKPTVEKKMVSFVQIG